MTSEEVRLAVASFSNGSAVGFDGLSSQHLKDVTFSSSAAARDVCEALASLVDLMLRSCVPADVCPVLYGALLTALKKSDGCLRPIA